MAQTKIYHCANANAYDQPNSNIARRVTTFGFEGSADLVSRFTEANGMKWVQVKWFNGIPGHPGASWIFGWVRAKDICR